MRWEGRGRPGSLLLRGDDLKAALSWIKGRKVDAPEISDLQRALVTDSADAEYAHAKAEKVARGRVRRVQAGVGLLVAANRPGDCGMVAATMAERAPILDHRRARQSQDGRGGARAETAGKEFQRMHQRLP